MRSLAVGLLAPLGAGSLGGLAFGIYDVCRASTAAGHWLGASNAAAVISLWLWFGQPIGMAVWLTGRCVPALKRWLPNRAAWQGLPAAIAGTLSFFLGRKVFGGNGFSGTSVAIVGPWFAAIGAVLGAWFVSGWMTRGSARATSWGSICGMAVLSVAAVALDRGAPGGYLYLHVLLLTLALSFAALAVQLAAPPLLVGHVGLVASLVTLPCLIAFPASYSARELLSQPTWAGVELIEYVQFHVDFDHDGQSPVFGGGDCNDADSSVFIGAPERRGDGRDSDCDGLDDPKPCSLVSRPFRNLSAEPEQLVARAKHLPTVVILIDALRFDRIGDGRFPRLAQLAGESISFSHVYSTSATTLTSVPAMMTGQVRPTSERENIAQALARAAQTSAFVGPDVVTEHFDKLGPRNPLSSFSSRESIPTNHTSGWDAADTVSTSDQITARAIALLNAKVPPDLLWLHYFDIHQWNALKGSGLNADGDLGRYDAVLERLDLSLGPLLDMRDRLEIVLLADHGEALGARGLRYHANFVFQQLAHIPLLVRIPGIRPATVAVPVTGTSVFNTLRVLRGLDPDPAADQGLLALVGATDVGDGPGFPSFDNAQWSLLFGNHRLLYMPDQQLVELYDVAHDPSEQINLLDTEPGLASQMLTRLFQLHNETRP